MFKFKGNHLKRDALICTLLSVITAGIFYFFVINLTFLDPFEKAFKDFSLSDIYYSENLKEEQVSSKIILVNVAHHNRLSIAKALDKIGAQNPKAIGIDIIFKDKREAVGDSVLKSTLSKYNTMVSSFYFEDDEVIKNHPYFETSLQKSGFINLNFENKESSVIRSFTGAKTINDTLRYSLPVQLARNTGYLTSNKELSTFKNNLLINYTGNESSFLTFEIDDILQKESIPAFKNSIVLLGFLGTPTGNKYDIEDKLFTPLNSKFVGKSIPDMYGIVVHANILNMIIEDNYVVKIPNFISYTLALIFCFLMTLFSLKIEKRNSFIFLLSMKLLQLLFTIVLLYFTIVLLKYDIHLNSTPIIVLTLLGIEMIPYYIHLFKYLKKRFLWKSYVLDS